MYTCTESCLRWVICGLALSKGLYIDQLNKRRFLELQRESMRDSIFILFFFFWRAMLMKVGSLFPRQLNSQETPLEGVLNGSCIFERFCFSQIRFLSKSSKLKCFHFNIYAKSEGLRAFQQLSFCRFLEPYLVFTFFSKTWRTAGRKVKKKQKTFVWTFICI